MSVQRIKVPIIDAETNEMFEILLTAEEHERATMEPGYVVELLQQIRHATSESAAATEVSNEQIIADGNAAVNPNSSWSFEATKMFLSMYEDFVPDLKTGKIMQKDVFGKIAVKMAEESFSYTEKQCCTKMTTMKRKYKEVKDHNGKSGNDPYSWKHFSKMDELFGKMPYIQPLSTCSSSSNASNDASSPLDDASATAASTVKSPPPKKTKMASVLEKFTNRICDSKERAQQDKNARHEATMERFDTMNGILRRMVDKENEQPNKDI